jgi:hypothetical protein
MKRENLTTSFFFFILHIFSAVISLLSKDIMASTSDITILEKEYEQNSNKQYGKKDFVLCLDHMFLGKNESIHLAFLGDSLVRNQFLNLISVS